MAVDLDFSSLLYDPQYDIWGVTLAFTNPKTSAPATLTVIDGSVKNESGNFRASVQSQRVEYFVRMTDIAALGLSSADFKDLVVSVDGANWTVSSWAPDPGPAYGQGEIILYLAGPT